MFFLALYIIGYFVSALLVSRHMNRDELERCGKVDVENMILHGFSSLLLSLFWPVLALGTLVGFLTLPKER